MKIFSGESNLNLSEKICTHLDIKLGEIFHHHFPSGETYCQYKENIRGADVFLVQGITQPANENLMQLLVMADAARRASADRITAVVPYFGYARQDRKEKSRVPITAKLVLDLFAASGINRVVTMDLHSPQVSGFTNLPFDHLTFEPVLFDHIDSHYDKKDLILMAPDVGALKRVEKYANGLKCDFGFIAKKRINDDTVEFQSISGDVYNKIVIIIDDITESCGTLIQAAQACKEKGAKRVICAVTHGCFTEQGVKRMVQHLTFNGIKLHDHCIDGFIYSNTTESFALKSQYPGSMTNVHKLDVSELFAKAIFNIHNNQSVSELFI